MKVEKPFLKRNRVVVAQDPKRSAPAGELVSAVSLYIKKKLFIYSVGKQISSGISVLLPTAARRRRRRRRRTHEEGRRGGADVERLYWCGSTGI